MTEITEILSFMPELINGCKAISNKCSDINPGLLPNNRKKVKDLLEHISILEENIKSGFPALISLIKVYSTVSADVKIAKALSDKNHELLGLITDEKVVQVFLARFPSEMENDFNRVDKGMASLPDLDRSESGNSTRIIHEIRVLLDRLKQINIPANEKDKKIIRNSREKVRHLIGDISTKYNDLDGMLTRLLNVILERFQKV